MYLKYVSWAGSYEKMQTSLFHGYFGQDVCILKGGCADKVYAYPELEQWH